AAREILGIDLVKIATQFLGPGNWDPVPPDCRSFVDRGSFFMERKQFDQAIADFDRAIQLDEKSFDAFFHRGIAYDQVQRFTESISDYERAIELDKSQFDAANNLAWILATCPEDEIRNGERALALALDVCERSG